MSKKVDCGGPAFPHGWSAEANSMTGMSLRDWLAGQVVVGVLSSGDFLSLDGLFTGNGAPVIADAAYLIADAMIAARNKDA